MLDATIDGTQLGVRSLDGGMVRLSMGDEDAVVLTEEQATVLAVVLLRATGQGCEIYDLPKE